jgi:hypothetical protein
MKTLCPEDFEPDQGKIDLLNAWGKTHPPKGDQKCGEWFTTRIDIIAEFKDYWTYRAKDKKKIDWQGTYSNYIKRIAWPNELRDYENNRHKRPNYDSSPKTFTEVYGQLISGEPIKKPPRRHKPPPKPPQGEAVNPFDALEQMRKILK